MTITRTVNRVISTNTAQKLAKRRFPGQASETDSAGLLPSVIAPLMTATADIPSSGILAIALTPVTPTDDETVYSTTPVFRVRVESSTVDLTITLDVQYTPATLPDYSDAQFVTPVGLIKTVTLAGTTAEVLFVPTVGLALGDYHWRTRWRIGDHISEWTPGSDLGFTVAAIAADEVPITWDVDTGLEASPHLWQLVPNRGIPGDHVSVYGFGFSDAEGPVTLAAHPMTVVSWDHNDETAAGATSARVINAGTVIDSEHDLAVVTVPDVSPPGGPLVVGAVASGVEEQETYSVSGRFLYDPRGDQLVIVGVEQRLEHISHIPDGPEILPQIAMTGANTCRILVSYLTMTTGSPYSVADIDAAISAGLNGGMFIELAVDGGGDPSVYLDSGILSLILKWGRWIAVHLVGESDAASDNAWAAEVIDAVTNIRAAGVTCPLYAISRVFGRSLSCLLNKGAEVLAADPLHNMVFGWQAYWGLPTGTVDPINSMDGFYQGEDDMTLLEALDACAAAAFPIQIGLMAHSDPEIDDTLLIPYSDMMAELRSRSLGWLWWDYREGPDNLTDSGEFGDWTVYGDDVVDNDPNGIANAAVRTAFLQDQELGVTP